MAGAQFARKLGKRPSSKGKTSKTSTKKPTARKLYGK